MRYLLALIFSCCFGVGSAPAQFPLKGGHNTQEWEPARFGHGFAAIWPGTLESGKWETTQTPPKDPVDREEFEKLRLAASELGLAGKWIVLSCKKDKTFSKAQIGQQPNDVISIDPNRHNNESRVPVG